MPILPILDSHTLRFKEAPCTVPSILDHEFVGYVDSGTGAISLALSLGRVTAGCEVLVPAYNCPSMVAPIVSRGAKPVFYQLLPDLQVDMSDLASRMTNASRALIVPHYFGFFQPMTAISQLCRQRGIFLVEDCAHAFFGENEGRPVGGYGDCAIASVRKFFPVFDGGLLVSRAAQPGFGEVLPHRRQSSLRPAINILEEAFEYGRLPVLDWTLGVALSAARRFRGARRSPTSDVARSALAREPVHDPARSYKFDDETGMSRVSRAVMKRCRKRDSIARRRSNYRALSGALSKLTKARVLLPELASSTVPYMLPLLLHDPDRDFAELKRRAVPLYRWDDARPCCAVSAHYTKSLVQVPCHQSLTAGEVDWILSQLFEVLQ